MQKKIDVFVTDLKILLLLCEKGCANILEITKNIGSIGAYTFVRERIKKLEKKGLIKTERSGREIKVYLMCDGICNALKKIVYGEKDKKCQEEE